MTSQSSSNRPRKPRPGATAIIQPDLFARELDHRVSEAFSETAESPAPDPAPPTVKPSQPQFNPTAESKLDRGNHAHLGSSDASRAPSAAEILPSDDLIPARILNEFIYCPRLFYYEHVEGVFVGNADTERGASIHRRVDAGKGDLPQPAAPTPTGSPPAARPDGETIHSRSVTLASERLGAIAKLDLVEGETDSDGDATRVCPVDYKAGSPRPDIDGRNLWDTDRMQLGLQCLILRDNGYRCDRGIIYYRGTKQRVPLQVTEELEAWILDRIAAARATVTGPIPPPLVDSPKCTRCSLAPVCLPDETRFLASWTGEDPSPPATPIRRSMTVRDDRRTLYLNTPGLRVGCNDSVLRIKEERTAPHNPRAGSPPAATPESDPAAGSATNERLVEEIRLSDVHHVSLFGNIQISTKAIRKLCDLDIPVSWFSMGGWFYGITRGHSLKNVQLRIEQFRQAADAGASLRLARRFVRGKIHNQRVLFMRNHVEPPETVKRRLGEARDDALAARSLEELLGIEGAAAALYFREFPGLIRNPKDDELPGLESPADAPPPFSFDFAGRNRRPPTDPVNAMLSLAYSLLTREAVVAAYAVGLDPYVGFYHQPRHGRPALALDVMEEFRPLVADSTVITAINNRFVNPADFVRAGRAVNLNAAGRKAFFQCFEQRIKTPITHPVFDYKVSYRRAIELQFRLLARTLTGEISEYVPFTTR